MKFYLGIRYNNPFFFFNNNVNYIYIIVEISNPPLFYILSIVSNIELITYLHYINSVKIIIITKMLVIYKVYKKNK